LGEYASSLKSYQDDKVLDLSWRAKSLCLGEEKIPQRHEHQKTSSKIPEMRKMRFLRSKKKPVLSKEFIPIDDYDEISATSKETSSGYP
jgi:hypothetical protein